MKNYHITKYLCKIIYQTKSSKADFPTTPLRHTFFTDCQAAGVPLNVAKELMGHSDMAKIYTHMVDEVFEQNRKRLEEYANEKESQSKMANNTIFVN